MSAPHDPRETARLRALLGEAVGDVAPADRLTQIQQQAARGGRERRRTPAPWWYAVGGAVAATVLVAVGISVLGGQDDGGDPVADPTSSGPPLGIESAPSSGTPTATGEPSAVPPEESVLATVYYVVDGPRRAGLVTSGERVAVEGDAIGEAAVQQALDGPSSDPDYRTLWPAGTTAQVSYGGSGSGGTWSVELANDETDLSVVPDGWSEREVDLALGQIAYTLRATTRLTNAGGEPPAFSVEVSTDDGAGEVLGRPAGPVPFAEQEIIDLHLVNIYGLEEGTVVEGGQLVVSGGASSPENTVPWELRRDGEVVLSGFATAEGDVMSGALLPWSVEIDVSALPAGTYEFVAMTEDASGGDEGAGPSEDTRTVVVE